MMPSKGVCAREVYYGVLRDNALNPNGIERIVDGQPIRCMTIAEINYELNRKGYSFAPNNAWRVVPSLVNDDLVLKGWGPPGKNFKKVNQMETGRLRVYWPEPSWLGVEGEERDFLEYLLNAPQTSRYISRVKGRMKTGFNAKTPWEARSFNPKNTMPIRIQPRKTLNHWDKKAYQLIEDDTPENRNLNWFEDITD